MNKRPGEVYSLSRFLYKLQSFVKILTDFEPKEMDEYLSSYCFDSAAIFSSIAVVNDLGRSIG